MAKLSLPQAMRLAREHQRGGRVSAAQTIYRRVLAKAPQQAEALFRLGVLAYQAEQYGRATQLLRRAAEARPRSAPIHYHLGMTMQARKKFPEAIASYRRAVELKPEMALAWLRMGHAHSKRREMEQAVACYRRVVALRPQHAEAHSDLGNALRDLGALEESETMCRKAIALKPDFAFAHCNLGAALDKQGRLGEAMECYNRAIVLKPDYAGAHWNKSLILLLRGDYERGWAEYEWRWRWRDFPSPKRDFSQPLWDGAPLEGRTILLHAEQGLGDTIQFIRFAKQVADRGGRVVLETQAELKALMKSAAGVAEVVARQETLPAFDVHAPMMSLPYIFGTRLETIPAEIPYLTADPQRLGFWDDRLSSALDRPASVFKIGLVWAGRPAHGNDRNRSLPLLALAPLGAVQGAQFYSLQKGDPAAQAKEPSFPLTDWASDLHDFSDTAAFMSHLDLIISVDTSVVHLAGALGRPVWTLVPYHPDWRWQQERSDSPWYPTMRLFRQTTIGDWREVIQELTLRLEETVSLKKKTFEPLS